MGKEIEKKYLLYEETTDYTTDNLHEICNSITELQENVLKSGTKIQQGYFPIKKGMELAKNLGIQVDFEPSEARIRNKGGEYYFTLKGDGGTVRNEIEVIINEDLFKQYWVETKGKRVEKLRLKKPYNGKTAEIDVYLDRKLIIAEVETQSEEEAEKLKCLGKDVTNNPSYKNKNLAR